MLYILKKDFIAALFSHTKIGHHLIREKITLAL